jgi:hypothetical protein
VKPRFISVRNDGLGARLRPILNAVALARECRGTFEFSWPENTHSGSESALGPANNIFSQKFIAQHQNNGWLELFDCTRGGGPRREQFRSHILRRAQIEEILVSGQSTSACHIVSFDDLRNILKRSDAGNVYREAFEALEFSEHINRAIRAALEVNLPHTTAAVHLRAGDIVERGHRFSGNYTQWVLPFPLVHSLVDNEIENGRHVIIFGQDPVVAQYICASTGAQNAVDLSENHMFDETQIWFFEICLMARCSRIIAGGASSFSQLAAWIGNTTTINGYDLFDATTAVRLTLSTDIENAPPSDLQKAFSFWTVADTYDQGIILQDRLACLKNAVRYDPDNSLYKLALINTLVAAGDCERASDLLSSMIDAETGQRDWFPGCLRQTLFEISMPSSKSRAYLLSHFQELWLQGDFGAGLCIVLTSHDPTRIAALTETLLASNWPARSFFDYAMRKRLEDIQTKGDKIRV